MILGSDQGFGDSVCRRGCLLPRLQRHSLRRQRGERASLDAAAGADDAPEHSGDEKPSRDSQRPGKHISLNAGESMSVQPFIFSGERPATASARQVPAAAAEERSEETASGAIFRSRVRSTRRRSRGASKSSGWRCELTTSVLFCLPCDVAT